MAVKDTFAFDIDRVFLNLDEFAEIHNLNGTETSCVVNEAYTKELSTRQSDDYDDMYRGVKTVHIKQSALLEMPVRGEIFRVDGEIYIVTKCSEEMGMLVIELEANES